MPVLLLERLPLPSLEAYAAISISLFVWSLHYSSEKTLEQDWRKQFGDSFQEDGGQLLQLLAVPWLGKRGREVLTFCVHDSLCVWTVVNFAYCLLVLFGNWLQKQVFGELRVSELQHIKDKFWNFVFYKFIFIFGIINVQSMEGVIMWGSWFSVIGFLHLHAQLCQDRFEYLSMTACTPRHCHKRLLLLLVSILLSSGFLFSICFAVAQHSGWVTFTLVAPECLLLALRATHTIARYLLHLKSLDKPATTQLTSQGWSQVPYYVEMFVEICCLTVDLAHHVHMLLRANMLLSMASLVIFMQLRVLYAQLMGRLKRHRNFRRIAFLISSSCPIVLVECEPNSSYEDCKCAICWEGMAQARKLACGHNFHHGCLLYWLEQDPSCPTCRKQLPDSVQGRPRSNAEGTRWSNWSWTGWSRLLQQSSNPSNAAIAENSQLENLSEQIQQMFPDYAINDLIHDLSRTRSLDATVENILDGRLLPTVPLFQQVLSHSVPSSSDPNAVPTLPNETVSGMVQFVDSPEQRQLLLQSRKRDLRSAARLKFMQRHASPDPSPTA